MQYKIDTKELTMPKQQASKAVSAANALTIEKKEDLVGATELLTKIRQATKLVEEKKMAITRPINEALAEVRSLFRPMEDNLSEATRVVKGKMIAFQTEADREAREAEARLAARVDRGTMKFETAQAKIATIERPESRVESESGRAVFRSVRDVEIVDKLELVKAIAAGTANLEYIEIKLASIRKDALAGKDIPGVKVVERKQIA